MKNKITDCKHRINDSPAVSELIAKILNGPAIPSPPNLISSEEDYIAHLFYDKINPTIEFTLIQAQKSQTVIIPSNDVYLDSWQVKGFNLPALGILTSFDGDTLLTKHNVDAGAVQKAANRVAFNMDLLGFPRANALQIPQSSPQKEKK